uniref:Uncharacterized protein n=1 Tax=Globodera rostochiensis TaxID=31243 RepID=A0A914I3Y8_GLORO
MHWGNSVCSSAFGPFKHANDNDDDYWLLPLGARHRAWPLVLLLRHVQRVQEGKRRWVQQKWLNWTDIKSDVI